MAAGRHFDDDQGHVSGDGGVVSQGHDHRHGHRHHHGAATADNLRRVRLAFFLTAGFMLAEFVGGWFANSLALMADAGHMLADSMALALTWAGFHLSARPIDARRSYGYARAQVLAAFVNGFALFGVAVWIVIEAIGRIQTPAEVKAGPMLVVALLGLAVNGVAFAILHRGDRHNINLRGALYHVMGDILGSLAAIAAALVITFTGWMTADPVLSLLVAALISWGALDLVRRSAHVLLEGAPDIADSASIKQSLMAGVPELADVHHVHVWSLTEEHPLVTLHARLRPGSDSDHALVMIKDLLRRDYNLAHATVQIEYGPCPD